MGDSVPKTYACMQAGWKRGVQVCVKPTMLVSQSTCLFGDISPNNTYTVLQHPSSYARC